MSQEDAQELPVAVSYTPISVTEGTTFAELIRAREEQQHRIRNALEEQNSRLRARLVAIDATNGNIDNSSDTPRAPRRSTGSTAKSLQQKPPQKDPQSSLHYVPVEEFVTFVTELKDLIHSAQEADLVVLHALQDRVEFQGRDLQQRMAELEAQLIAARRTASLPVPDAASLQYIVREVDEAQRVASETHARAAASEETLQRQEAALGLFEKDLNALEMKCADIAAAHSALRHEVGMMEGRYAAGAASCAGEGTSQDCSSEAPRVPPLISVALEAAVSNALNAVDTAEEAKATGVALQARLDGIQTMLRQMILPNGGNAPAHFVHEENAVRVEVEGVQETKAKEEEVTGKDHAEMRERVAQMEAQLATLSEHMHLMQEQQRTLVHTQKDEHTQQDVHDSKPHANTSSANLPAAPCPPGSLLIDAGQLDAMAREVAEAAAALERAGLAELRRTPSRVARLEERIAALEDRAARPGFSVRAVSPSATQPPSTWSPAPYAPPALAAPRAAATAKDTATDADTETRIAKFFAKAEPKAKTMAFGPFSSPPVALGAENAARAASEVRGRRRRKEEALAKVIAALSEVQQRFEDLDARERRGHERSRDQQPQQQKERQREQQHVDPVALRKEAVHAKQQKLLDMRNALWREIAQLKEDERELIGS